MKKLLIAGAVLFFWANVARSQIPQSLDLENDPPEHRATVTCGATLDGHKTFKLKADLDCSTATAPITVRDKAVFNLNGHTLFGSVLLRGQRAQLKNGSIVCNPNDLFLLLSACVVLRGEGKHLLSNVTVRDVVGAEGWRIVVTSNNNSLTGNTSQVGGALGGGFAIQGHNNILRGNIVVPSGDDAYSISGNGNLIRDNASVTHSDGQFSRHFVISGSRNTLVHNVVGTQFGHSGAFHVTISASKNIISRNVIFNEGIIVDGQNNVIEQNFARGEIVYLEDSNANCDNNRWRNNMLESPNPIITQPCIQ
jgi:hypothetical protein